MDHPQVQDANAPQQASQPQVTVVQVRKPSLLGSFYSIIHALAALFAIFLSFRCNQGFDIGAFLAALLCPYIYIIYQFAQAKALCGILG